MWGQTDCIEHRLAHHNSGISPYTSITRDWVMVYHEEFLTRGEAIKRERQIKAKKSRKYIEWLVSSNGSAGPE